uniref:Variant surface glycoprotein 1125.1481 n=1 Tax=Trypanosoma brucei TaxID=5691 RepID=A0A1J0R726_9TRYP|nr:variant surface glycoprotein 1125.1481 [Trypanosoma brucei]
MLTKLGLIFLAVQTATPSATNKNCTDAGQDMTYIGQVTKGLLVKLKTEPTGEDIIVKLQLFTAATTDRRKAAAAVAAANAMSRCRRRATTSVTEAASTVGGQLAGLSFHFGRHTALAALKNANIKAAVRQTFGSSAKILGIQLGAGAATGLETSKCTPTEYATHGGNPTADEKHGKQHLRMSVVATKAARNANDAGQAQACATDGNCASAGDPDGIQIQAGPLYTTTEAQHHSEAPSDGNEKLTIYVSSDDQADQLRQLDSETRTQPTEAGATKIDCRPWEAIGDEELLKDVTAITNEGRRPATIDAESIRAAKQAVKDLFGGSESEW